MAPQPCMRGNQKARRQGSRASIAIYFLALYDNPWASCRRSGCNTFISLGIGNRPPCLCHQPEDLVIPYIGPEIIAVLLNKRTLERNEPFISGCLMKQAAAKAARWFIARCVSKFFAIKAKRTLYSQPPSTRYDICSSARNKQIGGVLCHQPAPSVPISLRHFQ
jgi:hypothetical protein